MTSLRHLEIWFVTGSQHLYGEEILEQVGRHSAEIAQALNTNERIAVSIVFKPVVKTPEEIHAICQQANASAACIGIIAWMHTFSPAKMWIRGLSVLQRPLLHLHTQFNRDIPWDTIDMDFMNLNQSAHGDREFGFINSRMRLRRKVVTGHWRDTDVIKKIDTWSRAAAGWHDWQGARFVRFGDNMRQVAVTEGDKVEAELKFGYAVNTHGAGDLTAVINSISEQAVTSLCEEYAAKYSLSRELMKDGQKHLSLREAAKIETGLRTFLEEGGYKGFTDTFEDLHGLAQLPGIAAQRLMGTGYGFAGEGLRWCVP
jgi:L-arabinose isomerase